MGFLKYDFDQSLDSPDRTLAHKEIIQSKSFLKKLYLEWYAIFTSEMKNLPAGKIIELGSGGGFLKSIHPEVITSDILSLEGNDMTFSALEMPFTNEEISAILMIDTFHHIPDSNKFLEEADRVLKSEGKIVMIEPANSTWGRFIYQNFHHEPFDPNGSWKIPETGPLSGANGALPWIVFERDREKFNEQYSRLKINSIRYTTPTRYLVSGGVSYKSLAPAFSFNLFRGLDRLLSFVSKQISMFMIICIEKN